MASQQRKKSSTQFMISPKKIGSSTMYGNSEGEYCQIELDGLRNDVHLRMSVGRKAKIIESKWHELGNGSTDSGTIEL